MLTKMWTNHAHIPDYKSMKKNQPAPGPYNQEVVKELSKLRTSVDNMAGVLAKHPALAADTEASRVINRAKQHASQRKPMTAAIVRDAVKGAKQK
jgi:hypothetical protein